MAKQTRRRTLATGASTNVSVLNDGKFQLSPGKLTTVTVTAGAAAQPPFLANAVIEFDDSTSNRLSLNDPKWLRGDTTYGHREAWAWTGEIDVDRDDHILFPVRNDTGQAVIWVGGWTVV